MNETPTYTQFNFQNEEDLSFGMFDVPSTHPGFHQTMHTEVYADAFSLHAQASSSGHISSQNSPFAFIPRSFVTSYEEQARSATPYLTHPKLESPSLSNGSSSTPETKESQQLLVTPKYSLATRHVVDDEDEDGEEEEDDDDEDFDDDPSPLLSSSSARNKLGGKQHKATTTTAANPKEREGKRRHFLQRNRVAAMKCRKKKKEWVNDLEETKSGLESQNTHLHMELDGLVDEASRIRAQLMVHANCNDANIDKWIENEAKRFVIGTGERYDQILAHAHFSPTQGQQQQQQQHQDGGMSSSAGSEYHAGGGHLISPLATPSSQIPNTPHPHPASSPAFYTHTAPPSMSTPGCYGVPPHEAAQFAQGLGHAHVGDEEPDYDGMSISLYDHSVS